ncbi:MAG TPA: lipopolysaccharide kinase InaA family protein [Actinocrinis sp.]|nr:lipopolysaccharide kinase InaA family protein [Actinocrinis sp.]
MPTGDDNAFGSPGPQASDHLPAPQAYEPMFDNAAGRRLADRYRLVRLVRRYPGDPAPEYWVGFDEVLNREVGVYLLSDRHPRALEIAQAARESATVIDAHFIQILDVDTEGSLCFVVTEWVAQARDLGALVTRTPLSVQAAHGVVRQLAEAVGQAHACDITHGDLKPSAVLVTATGQIKILGLHLEAALLGADPRRADPAAARGADVRAIAQLWYVALTGRWPGESAHGLPAAPDPHGRLFSPAQVRAGVPRPVDRLVTEALDPGRAPYEAKTLAAAIAALPRMREDDEPTQLRAAVPRPPAPTAVQPAIPSSPDPYAPSYGSHAAPPVRPRSDPRPTGSGRPPSGGSRTRGLIVAAVAAVAVIGTLAAFEFGGGGGGSPQANGASSTAATSAAPTTPQQVSVVSDSVWDSDKGQDDASIAPKAYDPSSSTGWSTSTYVQATEVGSYRKGTGLIFDLGSAQKVGSVTFDAAAAGATAEVWTAPAGLAALPSVSNSAPSGFTKQGAQTGVGGSGDITFSFTSAVTTRYVLIWFTALPHQDPDQDHPLDGYRDNIADVKIYS